HKGDLNRPTARAQVKIGNLRKFFSTHKSRCNPCAEQNCKISDFFELSEQCARRKEQNCGSGRRPRWQDGLIANTRLRSHGTMGRRAEPQIYV
ncbi:MAG: hypothetical protein ACYTBJ_18210, partial [Planctomycetota bacterium]